MLMHAPVLHTHHVRTSTDGDKHGGRARDYYEHSVRRPGRARVEKTLHDFIVLPTSLLQACTQPATAVSRLLEYTFAIQIEDVELYTLCVHVGLCRFSTDSLYSQWHA